MDCKNCTGSCGACSGCGASLTLTAGEIHILQELAIYAFLPVARKADAMTPCYPEGSRYAPEEYSTILQHLERKGLIDLDYGAPVGKYDSSIYASLPVHGSMALTLRGQQVVELMDMQGIIK